MEYYKLLQLKREPFSNSPDPDYFFQSRQHHSCLQKLELALRLKRGLNVVMGDVGTGKTTLCREIIRKFEQEPEFETHLILDPSFSSTTEMLALLYAMFCEGSPDNTLSEMALKEKIKQTLFQKGVDHQNTIVLIIDEGQKISSACVEILRELLNYETNNYKLLQIIIFAQKEFSHVLNRHANFADRINLLHQLKPLDFADTRKMIQHRLKLSSETAKPRDLFTLPALWTIYRATKGYPRKIVHLCHQSVLALIIQNRTRAGWALIRSCQHRMVPSESNRWRTVAVTGAAIVCILVVGALLLNTANKSDHQTSKQLFHLGETVAQVQSVKGQTTKQSEVKSPSVTQKPIQPTHSQPGSDSNATESLTIESTLQTAAHNMTADTPTALDVTTTSPMMHNQNKISAAKNNGDEPPTNPKEPPASLGQLQVKPGDTLLELAQMVYGTLSNRYVRRIIDANPHLENPNTIHLDDVIHFPALPFARHSDSGQYHYIIMNQYTDLNEARDQLESLKNERRLPVALIAHWSAQEGLRFSLMVRPAFVDRQTADQWIKGLPDTVADTARIQSGWPEETLTYSSYFRTIHRQPITQTRR